MEQVITEQHDGWVKLTLNRPEAKNALNTAVLARVAEALTAAAADPTVRAALICGADGTFAAGADIAEIEAKTSAEGAHDPRKAHWAAIRAFPKPLVAAVDGFALALMEANKPNYLGSPRVLQGLFKPFMDAAFDHVFLEEMSTADLDRFTRNIISAMTDDPDYTRMPWHSREQLGAALIGAFNLSEDPQGRASLSMLVEQALAAVLEAIKKLTPASGHGEEAMAEWIERLEALGHFAIQVFLGTHQLSHPGMSLENLVDQLAG